MSMDRAGDSAELEPYPGTVRESEDPKQLFNTASTGSEYTKTATSVAIITMRLIEAILSLTSALARFGLSYSCLQGLVQ